MDIAPNHESHAGSFGFGLTQPEVVRFQDIMHREYGENLTPEAAWARAIELLALFRMLIGPLPEDASGASSNIGTLDQEPGLGQG